MTQDDFPKRKGNVHDAESLEETVRLLHMDRLLTEAMGGPFGALPDLPEHAHILDLACGPGGWAIDAASHYPSTTVLGADISQLMIEYARVRAQVHKAANVSFDRVDITKTLPFPDATFDVVHARLLMTVLLREDWEPLIAECRRVLGSQGVLLLTEATDWGVTNSPAFERIQRLTRRLLWQGGYGFSVDGQTLDVSFMLPHLLRHAGYGDIQHAAYALEFSANTSGWEDWYQNHQILFAHLAPRFVERGLASQEEIEHTHDRMRIDMKEADFCGIFHFMSVAGVKLS